MCRIRLWHPFVHGTTGCCKKHLQFLRVKNSGSFFHPPLPPLSTTIRMPWSVVSGPIWCPESSCNIHFHIAPFGCSGIAKRLWGENLPDGRRRLMPPEAEKQKISKVTAASHWLIFPELRSWLDYSGIWQIMTGYNDYMLRVIIEIDYKNFGLADEFQDSLNNFKEGVLDFTWDGWLSELMSDPIIRAHFTALYDNLLEQNLLRIIEPFSRVEVAHVASLVGLPVAQIEFKYSPCHGLLLIAGWVRWSWIECSMVC